MKTIGKIAVLVMTMSLAFALSACGGGNASSSAAASSAAAGSASASAAASSASASAAASSASAAASSASASEASSSDLADATSYTNDAFGLDFILPEGWTFMDAKTLAQANSSFAGIAQGNEVDMCAVSGDQSTAVVLAIIEPSSENAGMTAEEFLKRQSEQMDVASQQGMQVTTEDADITFTGMSRTLPATFTTVTLGDSAVVIGQAVAEKDGYFLDVVATGTSEDAVTNAFRAFKATAE